MQDSRPRLLKAFDSISVRIIALMVLFILPLNIGLILTNLRTIDAVRDQARLALENVGGLYLQRLEGRMAATDYYFYDLDERDAYFIRLQNRGMDDAYYLSKTNVAAEFNRSIQTSNNADAYFYAKENGEDFLLTLPGDQFGLNALPLRSFRERVEAFLMKEVTGLPKNWQMVSAGEVNWLLRIYGDAAFQYGGLISLDFFISQVKEAVEYQTLTVNLGTGLESEPTPGFLMVTVKSGRFPVSLTLGVSMEEIDRGLPQIRRLSLALAILSLLVIPVIILILSKILLKPLNKIRSALLRLKSGDQNYRIGPHRQYSEEFRVINRSFNDMADSIKTLRIENYEKELENKNLALRSLQLHIRPHFLLNTFNLVHSLAQIQEYKSIQTLALYLSDYFRYLFRSGKELEPFLLEFQMIQKYLEVSQIRYPNAFLVEYEVEEAALEVLVPPLLIHALVENIITHALDRKRRIQIKLIAKIDGSSAIFEVHDNGKGIASEVLSRLLDKEMTANEEGEAHLGLRNAVQRLQHLFGQEGKLDIDSKPGEGTSVLISFPYMKGEKGAGKIEAADRQ